MGRYVWASDYEARFEDTTEQLFSTEDVRRALTPGIQPLFPNGAPE